MINNLEEYFLGIENTIKDAINIIEIGKAQIALIVDSTGKLLGVVTDGDVRRGLLKGFSLDESVDKIMTKDPIVLPFGSTKSDAISLIKDKLIYHVPIVNGDGQIKQIHVLDDFLKTPELPNWTVIMAGGKGERLKPLTDKCPKPMLKIGDKPMLEIMLEQCLQVGLKKFYISVNYLKEQIIQYFGNGSRWNAEVRYLEEDTPLGTAGCLSMLKEIPQDDILVLNGDVVTKLDFDRLIKFHSKLSNLMTVCTRTHHVKIPFAVLNTANSFVKNFVEKPMYDYQVNTGVYVLNPSLLRKIPNKFFHMTDLIENLLCDNELVGAFPIHEEWNDVGNSIELDSVRTSLFAVNQK